MVRAFYDTIVLRCAVPIGKRDSINASNISLTRESPVCNTVFSIINGPVALTVLDTTITYVEMRLENRDVAHGVRGSLNIFVERSEDLEERRPQFRRSL